MTPRGAAAIALIACAACSAPPSAPGKSAAGPGGVAIGRETSWQDRFDLDGDGVQDHIEVNATGGASCCYTLSVISSRSGQRTAIPFELDGGYAGGLDLSQPERFAVTSSPSGGARLILEIATYNGEPQPIPRAWGPLGVASHRVAVTLIGGLHVENLGWRCEHALIAIRRELWAAWEGLPADCPPASVLDALDAVITERRLDVLGSERRPAWRYRAERATDGSTVIAYAEPRGARAPEHLVRLDLVSPRVAVDAAAALAPLKGELLGHIAMYWPVGLAIVLDGPGGAPAALSLVSRGVAADYLQRLAANR